MAKKGAVTGARTRDSPPDIDDEGLVVRPIWTGPFPVPIPTVEAPSTTTTVNRIPAAIAPTLLLAADPTRLGFSIQNDQPGTSAVLYVLAGVGVVGPANYTVMLVPGAYYEDPYRYVGVVTGVWDVALGDALVTAYLP